MAKNTSKEQSTVISPSRKKWLFIVYLLTFWIPSFVLRWKCCGRMISKQVQVAWREKLALNILIWISCTLVLFYIIGLSRILCPVVRVLSQGEIDGLNTLKDPFVVVYGNYYKIDDIIKTHSIQQQYISTEALRTTVLGQDISAMFTKVDYWSKYCPNITQASSGWDNIIRAIPKQYEKLWYIHSATTSAANQINNNKKRKTDYLDILNTMKRGAVGRDAKWIADFLADNPLKHRIIIAYDRVYDISTYFDESNRVNFLGDRFKSILQSLGPYGKDATPFFEELKSVYGSRQWNQLINCMDGLFYTGVVDRRNSAECIISNYILLASSAVLMLVIGFKFVAAVQMMASKRSPASFSRHVVIQIPCYTEGAESLNKTLRSVATSHYSDKHKLLFFICDGMITGSGNDRTTPEILLDLLGIRMKKVKTTSNIYSSLGEQVDKTVNYAQVYSGIYVMDGHHVPFIVVVKMGKANEDHRPGNRGKRDSQLLLMRFLSAAHFESPMTPVELEIYHQMHFKLGLDPKLYEFMLMVDADTEVSNDSVNRMVSAMIQDGKIVGICGDTTISNKRETWVTMIQQYEYFISHHMAKAFESMFGSVTCLPGCFCMYRVRSPTMNVPYLISPQVIRDYQENNVNTLHKKNLLQLGEDRYLTTIMMKHFPYMKLSFTPDAKCQTNVPEKWDVFKSQRRRWINSTVHNLVELLNLPELCGFCLFSMRFVVLLDLIATIVQPAAVVYVGYIFYSLFGKETDEVNRPIPLISLIMIGAIYGLQVIMLMLKKEWQHIGWMFFYMLAQPVYSFYLPLYSFWHFDDFSWGNTRLVVDEETGTKTVLAVGDNKKKENNVLHHDSGEDNVYLHSHSDPDDERGVNVGKSSSTILASTHVEKVPLMTWEEYRLLLSERVKSMLKEDDSDEEE